MAPLLCNTCTSVTEALLLKAQRNFQFKLTKYIPGASKQNMFYVLHLFSLKISHILCRKACYLPAPTVWDLCYLCESSDLSVEVWHALFWVRDKAFQLAGKMSYADSKAIGLTQSGECLTSELSKAPILQLLEVRVLESKITLMIMCQWEMLDKHYTHTMVSVYLSSAYIWKWRNKPFMLTR